MANSDDMARASVHGALLLPFRAAALVALTGLVISLMFLAYTAWSSAQRVIPLERHLQQMQQLQQVSADIQGVLVRNVETKAGPKPGEIAGISAELDKILKAGGALSPDAEAKLKQAVGFLDGSESNLRVGLVAALGIVRDVLSVENNLQRATVQAVHNAAQREVTIAVVILLLLPLSAMLLLSYVRRRAFRPLQSLGELLENVGNLDFRSTQLPDPKDPFYPVYDRYNHMTQRLIESRLENAKLQSNLTLQVRAATETLLRQQRDLADSAQLAAIGEFSARVAHELRNPLSGILLALRNMERETDDPDQKQRYNAIIDEIERIKRLLAGLLEKAPQAPESPVSLDLSVLVNDVVTLFRYQTPDDIGISQDVGVKRCKLPRDTIRQVLLNLLRNSVEAMVPNPGDIAVHVHHDNGMLHFRVADTGPGYPEDLLRHGVRPFWSQKAGGSGLGLAVVRRLVHSVGGELNLSNLSEGGARAEITLPCELE